MNDLELLQRVKSYIERMEEFVEAERGMGRNFEELHDSGDAPELYYLVVARVNELGARKPN